MNKGLKDILIGLAIAIVGLVITFISYSSAAENGGTYDIYYGLILVGVVYAGKGVFGLFKR